MIIFSYNTDEVDVAWTDVGVLKMREKMELADYELIDIEAIRMKVPYPAGFWHELTMVFHFKRRAGWYILQAYLPTYLTIFICTFLSQFCNPRTLLLHPWLLIPRSILFSLDFIRSRNQSHPCENYARSQ